jgi:lipooligosaccharide transport system permease protein
MNDDVAPAGTTVDSGAGAPPGPESPPDAAPPRAPVATGWALPARLTRAVPMLLVAEREARLFRTVLHTVVFTDIVLPLLFLGAMGIGLGGLVDESTGTVEGVDYLVFVAPGILAATAFQTASGASLWRVMGGVKWNRNFHAATATPITPGQVYGGYVAWTGARTLVDAALFVAVAAVLGAVPTAWGVLAVPAAALGALAIAAPLTAYSAGRDSDQSFPLVMRIAVVPMFLFSGTFFPVDQLPDRLQPLARVSPLWHAVELCRGATTGSLSLLAAVGHTAFLLACIGAGCWWGIATFRRKLAP